MQQNAQKMRVDDSENYPELTVVNSVQTSQKRSSDDRPELLVLGWGPRQQRLALRTSAQTSKR